MLSIHQFLPLVALALNLLLMGSALIGDRKHQRNFMFAYVTLGLAIWNLGVFGLRGATDPLVAMSWERVVHFGVIPVPLLFYHYVLVFLDVPRRGPALILGYALAIGFMVVSPTPWFLRGVQESVWGFMPDAGPLYAPFLVYCYAYLGLGLARLIRAHGTTTSAFRRNRTRFVILGASVTILGGAVDFLRFILEWNWLYPLGIPSNAFFTLCLGIAIVRYRLWDVSILAKRVVLYALVSLVIVPITTGAALYVIAAVAPHDEWWPNIPLVSIVLVLLAGVTASLPLLRRVEIACERFMFARQHGVREALNALSKEMSSTLDLQRLGRDLTRGLVERVPVLHATLYLKDVRSADFTRVVQTVSPALDRAVSETIFEPNLILWLRLTGKPLTVEEVAYKGIHDPTMREVVDRLEAAQTALLVPLQLDGQLEAILAIGEKVAGEVFDSAEIELMEALVAQAGIALKNARLYEDLQLQMEELRATQQQLVQTAKLAAIGELAAGVAHELNNPLTVIVGNTDYLIRKASPGSIAVQLGETIKTEALRASRITRALLDFARRREPRREPVNVNTLVPRALELMQTKLRGRDIVVETGLDSNLPALPGDSDQLLQIMINLIGNAIDAMPTGGQLVVRTEAPEPTGVVRFSVSDTGIGMTDEQIARIFEPFYTTKPEGKGTGLGLSVTRGIVESHGGTITAESIQGRGTTMTVELPLSEAPRPGVNERVPAGSGSGR